MKLRCTRCGGVWEANARSPRPYECPRCAARRRKGRTIRRDRTRGIKEAALSAVLAVLLLAEGFGAAAGLHPDALPFYIGWPLCALCLSAVPVTLAAGLRRNAGKKRNAR